MGKYNREINSKSQIATSRSMRHIKIFENFHSNYNNWVKIAKEEDFIEYAKKEYSKWENRASTMGFRFPIFNSYEHFKESIDNAGIIDLNEYRDDIEHMTSINDIDTLRDLVHSYYKPRDIDRIINGFKNNDAIPMPIILKGKNGYFIMAGNTRQNTAYIMDINIKAILIDVSE